MFVDLVKIAVSKTDNYDLINIMRFLKLPFTKLYNEIHKIGIQRNIDETPVV